jgi:uncharacterized protein with HEPN domain
VESTLVRDAVERNLTIIGEALSRLERVDSETAHQISGFRRIIGLRHRLAHGYDEDIDDSRIWDTVIHSIPDLLGEINALLDGVIRHENFPDQEPDPS